MTEDGGIRVERGVVIHGGVGTLRPSDMSDEMRRGYEDALREALLAGYRALASGGSVDAVVEAVRVMEDSPLFNAGRGSNLDERGVAVMDASVMRGSDGEAGAVAGVTRPKNPVRAAVAVLEASEHLLLVGDGADAFAERQGLTLEDPSYFVTARRQRDLEKAREGKSSRPNVLGDGDESDRPSSRAGTVGAVALDGGGTLAAATSTGGMANKAWGRVGDSPIIGAGTWAGRLCAVSCTGWGERFIRHAVAHDVHARMAHGGASLRTAVEGVIWDELHAAVPRSGGLIAIDHDGNVELCFNTPGMYRGWVGQDGEASVAIYGGQV